MALISASEAAARLGVSERQVRNLVAHGQIVSVARGLVESDSVEFYSRTRGTTQGRAWTEPTAWAALELLALDGAPWYGASQTSRLRHRLRNIDAATLHTQLRHRARVMRFHGLTSAVHRLREELIHGSDTLGILTERHEADGYVDARKVDELIATYRLTDQGLLLRAAAGEPSNVTLRVTSMVDHAAVVAHAAPDLLAAIDLADSIDARERSSALEVLATYVRAHHD